MSTIESRDYNLARDKHPRCCDDTAEWVAALNDKIAELEAAIAAAQTATATTAVATPAATSSSSTPAAQQATAAAAPTTAAASATPAATTVCNPHQGTLQTSAHPTRGHCRAAPAATAAPAAPAQLATVPAFPTFLAEEEVVAPVVVSRPQPLWLDTATFAEMKAYFDAPIDEDELLPPAQRRKKQWAERQAANMAAKGKGKAAQVGKLHSQQHRPSSSSNL